MNDPVAVTQCNIPRDGKAGPAGAVPTATRQLERTAALSRIELAAKVARRDYDDAVAAAYAAEQKFKAARKAADRATDAMMEARERWRAARKRVRRGGPQP